MSKRTSVYLSDQAEAALDARQPGDSLSGRINSVVIRYAAIVRDECPALSEAEWSAVCDVANGSWLAAEHSDTDPARYLWAELADAPEMGEKWAIDHAALVARLRALRYAERVAVLEVARRFWASPRLNAASVPELLAEAGARMA